MNWPIDLWGNDWMNGYVDGDAAGPTLRIIETDPTIFESQVPVEVSPKFVSNSWTTRPEASSETSRDPSEKTTSSASSNLNVKLED
ncbi:hypothetical protein TWF225_011167 [Orbilia oligospora]|nr:hypothetical protein TWF225_011167 [Orbilia oligospora]KAF3248503.1 hypothetical protein TWF217_009101 [Orbilia oligospora]KAF3251289.1 hypothetical protein TWF128_007290 [Orbilia oligospora]KAF3288059.1 hypothetical protein TWF132_008038 [Orbilia oligospora]